MRRLLFSTCALLFLAPPVFAQPPSNHVGKASVAPEVQDRAQAQLGHPPQSQGGEREQGGGHERGGDRGGGRERGTPPPVQAAAPQIDRGDRGRGGGDNGRHLGADRGRGPDMDNRRAFDNNRPDDRSRTFNNRTDDNRRSFNDARPNRDINRDFNRDGRTDYRQPRFGGSRHDFSGFRDFHRAFNATRRFRAPYYQRPAGWYSHRWSYGETLPVAYFARDYWLIDFADYDLPPPPYGAVWVRVGSDALLIDEESGEVITVEYDIFY
jgi:Ni/Co efflux regulator RcnB